jgi:ribosomal protein S6--L-glutamate ligase
MRIAVLCSPDSWYFRDLRRAGEAAGHEIVDVPFTQLSAGVGTAERSFPCGGIDLRAFDAVVVRTMPPGSLEQVVFRMNALARLEAAGVTVVNPPKAVEAAVDKYLTSALLEAAGLRVPRTFVCQTSDEALAAFAALGRDIVLKPIFGSEGRGIARLQDEALAQRAFRMVEQLGGVLYVQEFVAHEGYDMRLFVVGRKVLGMRRRNPLDWRTNCSRGAVAEPLEVTPELGELAHRAAAAVGATVAGVDLLPGRNGELYAVEVNAVPGWKSLAAALQTDVARLVVDHVVECAAHKSARTPS